MLNEQAEIEKILSSAIEIVIEETREELRAQGHEASGALSKSLEGETSRVDFSAKILANFYWLFLDEGTKPHRPPFDAIYEWSKHVKPALSDNARKGFTWAVITNIGKEGTPTKGSYAYSQNGRRKEFAKEVIDASETRIAQMIEDSDFVEFIIEKAMRQGAGV